MFFFLENSFENFKPNQIIAAFCNLNNKKIKKKEKVLLIYVVRAIFAHVTILIACLADAVLKEQCHEQVLNEDS